jgi:hypothetical protein
MVLPHDDAHHQMKAHIQLIRTVYQLAFWLFCLVVQPLQTWLLIERGCH